MKFLEKNWKGKNYRFYVLKDQNSLWIHYKGQTYLWKKPVPKKTSETAREKSCSQGLDSSGLKQNLIKAHLPGRIQKVFVKKSQELKKGETLLTLSAMKIEYSIKAEGAGQVKEIFCAEGQSVALDQKLVHIEYKD